MSNLDRWAFTIKYETELDRIYDLQCFSRTVLDRVAWQSIFVAAREIGLSEEIATQFIQSKWIRHNEDIIMEKVSQTLYDMMASDSSSLLHLRVKDLTPLEDYIDALEAESTDLNKMEKERDI